MCGLKYAKDTMKLYDTLTDLFTDVKDRDREIRFIDGDKDESSLRFGELWEASLALLGSLQARGMKPGDELVHRSMFGHQK